MTTPPDPPTVAPRPGRWYRIWRVARYLLGLVALGAAAWAISGKTDELQGATSYLAHLHAWWLLVAFASEGVSYLAYASLQRRLLSAGGIKVPLVPMVGIGLAAQAIQNSLPAGTLFYFGYLFRQYRRYGADDVLAGWTLVAFNLVTFVALVCLAAVGLGMALSAGSAYDLVEAILAVVILAALVVVAWTERARLLPHLTRTLRLSQRLVHRPRPGVSVDAVIGSWLDHLGAINPSRTEWSRAFMMGLCNWLGDVGCLVLCFMAVGAAVPWKGLLLAYGAAQLASILPITPGGLGVVEGSLTVALVTFGGAETSTVAAVLLYRLISFWLLLPMGWGSWTVLTVSSRGRRRALETSPA